MRGISSVRKPNFVIDAKERNYMRPVSRKFNSEYVEAEEGYLNFCKY